MIDVGATAELQHAADALPRAADAVVMQTSRTVDVDNSAYDISLFDNVRVRSTPLTRERGLAGLTGQVYGETTPSVTNVDVIGSVTDDHAFNVHFDSRNVGFWFARDLLEFVDHAPGTEIRLDGVARKWVRGADGAWVDEETLPPSQPKRP